MLDVLLLLFGYGSKSEVGVAKALQFGVLVEKDAVDCYFINIPHLHFSQPLFPRSNLFLKLSDLVLGSQFQVDGYLRLSFNLDIEVGLLSSHWVSNLRLV